MICNESNGENQRMKVDEDNTGMKIYNSEQIEKSLEDAGFRGVKVDKTKGWICVVVKSYEKQKENDGVIVVCRRSNMY